MAQSFRILLVEDDDSLRACLGEFLSSQGWSVGATAFAEEALDLMQRHRFDFSLLDFHLPDTTGLELFQQLAAVRPLPSILMSGLASPHEAAAAREAGFFAFLRKPLDLRRLRQSLELLIESHFGGPLMPHGLMFDQSSTAGGQQQLRWQMTVRRSPDANPAPDRLQSDRPQSDRPRQGRSPQPRTQHPRPPMDGHRPTRRPPPAPPGS